MVPEKMKKKELLVRWHSRAGQGAVTAANFFAESLTHFDFKVQSFPDYGAEKRGAPVVVYNRFSKDSDTLDDPAHLKHLDLVILLDPTLVGAELTYEEILYGLKDDGILVINTSKQEASKFNSKTKATIFHLPATQIALDTVGRNVPNVAMVGGLTKILDIDPKLMGETLHANLSAYFPEAIVNKNMDGFQCGQDQIIEIKG